MGDERLKTNVVEISEALDKLKQIRGVKFNYIMKPEGFEGEISSPDVVNVGVIAQEIEKVLPELISEDKDGYKSVQYGHMAGFLIEVNKEQQGQIEVLQEQVKQQDQQLQVKGLQAQNEQFQSQIQMMMWAVGMLGVLVLTLFGAMMWVVLRQQKQVVATSVKTPLL